MRVNHLSRMVKDNCIYAIFMLFLRIIVTIKSNLYENTQNPDSNGTFTVIHYDGQLLL